MGEKTTFKCFAEANLCSKRSVSQVQNHTVAPLTLSFYFPGSQDTFDSNNSFTIDVNEFNKSLLANQPPGNIDSFVGFTDNYTLKPFTWDKYTHNNLWDKASDETLTSTLIDVIDQISGGSFSTNLKILVNNSSYYPLYMSGQDEELDTSKLSETQKKIIEKYPERKWRLQTFNQTDYIYNNKYFITDVPTDRLYAPRDYYEYWDNTHEFDYYEYNTTCVYSPSFYIYEGAIYDDQWFSGGYYSVNSDKNGTLTFYIFPPGLAYPKNTPQDVIRTYFFEVTLKFKTNLGFVVLEEASYHIDHLDQQLCKIKVTKGNTGWVEAVEFDGYFNERSDSNLTYPGPHEFKITFSPSWTYNVVNFTIDESLHLPYKLDANTIHTLKSMNKTFTKDDYTQRKVGDELQIKSKPRLYPYSYTGSLVLQDSFEHNTTVVNKNCITTSELCLGDSFNIIVDDSGVVNVDGNISFTSITSPGSVEIGGNNE